MTIDERGVLRVIVKDSENKRVLLAGFENNMCVWFEQSNGIDFSKLQGYNSAKEITDLEK